MKARINTARTIVLYYPPSGVLDTPRVRVLDSDATLVTTILLTQSVNYANVYWAAESYTFTATGEYTLIFEHLVATVYTPILTEVMTVGMDPTTDAKVSTLDNIYRVIDDDTIGDITSTVTCTVVDSDDSVVETVAATYSAAYSGYRATISPISSEGTYLLMWLDDGVIVHVEELLLLTPREYEQVTVELYRTSGSTAIPHTGVTVLFSNQDDGTAVRQDITDSNGLVDVILPPGDYYITYQKSGYVYTYNNIDIEVVDTEKDTGTNDFRLETDVFQPTWSPTSSSISTATIYAYLYDFTGEAMRDTEVLVTLAQGPDNFSSTPVIGTNKVYTTDDNGYVEFDLVQGAEVTVSIMSHAVRRTITVPSGAAAASPTDLFSLLATATDIFDIINIDYPETPRRSI